MRHSLIVLMFALGMISISQSMKAGNEPPPATREEVAAAVREQLNLPGGLLALETRDLPGAPGWSLLVKPWPDDIDHWTHFLHSAAGNAVAADRRVGHARALQWIAKPMYCHRKMSLKLEVCPTLQWLSVSRVCGAAGTRGRCRLSTVFPHHP